MACLVVATDSTDAYAIASHILVPQATIQAPEQCVLPSDAEIDPSLAAQLINTQWPGQYRPYPSSLPSDSPSPAPDSSDSPVDASPGPDEDGL